MNDSKIFPLLSIETSGDLCSASIHIDEKTYSEINLFKKYVHSEKLMEVIDNSLKLLDFELHQCSAIAVSMGPGSFTGLRIGLAAVKGLALGRNLPIIPVPSFEALALEINGILPQELKFFIANKVNLNEVYFAQFESNSDKYKVVESLQVKDKEELSKEKYKNMLGYGDLKMEKDTYNPILLTAVGVAKWAYLFGEDLLTCDHDLLEPNYLKQFKVRGK